MMAPLHRMRGISLNTTAAVLLAAIAPFALADNQTATVSPITVGHPAYEIGISQYDMGSATMPTLHSFATGVYDGKWVLIAGRTSGLHGFSFDPNDPNFPAEHQNHEVWVIDPVSKQTWSRSLEDASSGLTDSQIASLTPTNNQFYQSGDRLYMTGGYGALPGEDDASVTFDTLSAIDLPGMVDWVQTGTGTAAGNIRQVSDPLFDVTGGAMYGIDGKVHLVFGQAFEGTYNPATSGVYTEQVRTFTIQDDGTTLGFTHVQSSTPDEVYHRRDLNVYPTLANDGSGGLDQGLTALSGVFTPSRGAWTVPVEIDADGNPSTVDPETTPDTFRQGMNNYHSAKVGLFSQATGEMHEVLFGGITLQQYDQDTETFVTDFALPFTSQVTSVVRDDDGDYSQHWLGAFPELLDTEDNLMRFGANAEFYLADGITTLEGGIIDLDALTEETVIGYIYGGIVANAGHVRFNPDGLSSASGEVFAVTYTPAPEPGSLALLALGGLALARRRR